MRKRHSSSDFEINLQQNLIYWVIFIFITYLLKLGRIRCLSIKMSKFNNRKYRNKKRTYIENKKSKSHKKHKSHERRTNLPHLRQVRAVPCYHWIYLIRIYWNIAEEIRNSKKQKRAHRSAIRSNSSRALRDVSPVDDVIHWHVN